jgi:ATP-dependent Zn protease
MRTLRETNPPVTREAPLAAAFPTSARPMKISLLLISCCVVLAGGPLALAEADYMTYDKFISAVEAGSVKSATLDRFSQITGTYTVNGTERPFKAYTGHGSAEDVLLTRLLSEMKVAVTLKDQDERPSFFSSPGIIAGLVMFFVPLLTLILAFRINAKLDGLSKMNRLTPPPL